MDSDKPGADTPTKSNRDIRLTERSRDPLDAHRPPKVTEARRNAAAAKEQEMRTDPDPNTSNPARVLVPATPSPEPMEPQPHVAGPPTPVINVLPPSPPAALALSPNFAPTSQSQEVEMTRPPRGHALRDLYAGIDFNLPDFPEDIPPIQKKFMTDFYQHMRITADKDAIMADFLDDLAVEQAQVYSIYYSSTLILPVK